MRERGGRRRSRPESTGRLLGPYVRELQLGAVLHVLKSWAAVAGPLVSAHLQPVRYGDGVLFVRADQAVWGQELTFLKPELLRKYEEALGKPLVRDIRLAVTGGPGVGGPTEPPIATPRRPAPLAVPELADAEIGAIKARAAEHIRDPRLARRWANIEARARAVQAARRAAGQPECRKCRVVHPGPGPLCPICEASPR